MFERRTGTGWKMLHRERVEKMRVVSKDHVEGGQGEGGEEESSEQG
jgi:hypothetical protein